MVVEIVACSREDKSYINDDRRHRGKNFEHDAITTTMKRMRMQSQNLPPTYSVTISSSSVNDDTHAIFDLYLLTFCCCSFVPATMMV